MSRLTDVGVGGSLELSEARVARALAKLAEGSYGVCDGCGEPIAPARLAAAARERALHRVRAPRALGDGRAAGRRAPPDAQDTPRARGRESYRGRVATPQPRDDGGVVAFDEGDADRR